MTKQQSGQGAHAQLKLRIQGFAPLPGVKVFAEPFFIEGKRGIPLRENPKGSLGVDVFVSYNNEPVLAMELKTGKGYSKRGKSLRSKWAGTSLVHVKLLPLTKK